jgi:hypothetical protein
MFQNVSEFNLRTRIKRYVSVKKLRSIQSVIEINNGASMIQNAIFYLQSDF